MNQSDTPSNHQATDRAFTLLAVTSVIAAVIAGFWLLGSPNKQRLISLDADRVNHLMQIAGALRTDYGGRAGQASKPLPKLLSDTNVKPSLLKDPVTDSLYEYRLRSDSTYELCATFATDSFEAAAPNRRFSDERWAHPKGRHCYEFDVSSRDPKS